MKIECFECGKPAKCNHHVIPKSLGGKRTVPLCLKCHGLVHERDFNRHKALQKKGIEAAKKAGKYNGRKLGSLKYPDAPAKARELWKQGKSLREISAALEKEGMNISHGSIHRYMQDSFWSKDDK